MLSRTRITRVVISDGVGLLSSMRESNINVGDVSWNNLAISPYKTTDKPMHDVRQAIFQIGKKSGFENTVSLWKALPDDVVKDKGCIDLLFSLHPLTPGSFREVVDLILLKDPEGLVDTLPAVFNRYLSRIYKRGFELETFEPVFSDIINVMREIIPKEILSRMAFPVQFYQILFRYLVYQKDVFALIDLAEAVLFSNSNPLDEYFSENFSISSRLDMILKRVLVLELMKGLHTLNEVQLTNEIFLKILKHDDTSPSKNKIKGKSWIDTATCSELNIYLDAMTLLEKEMDIELWWKLFSSKKRWEQLISKWLKESKMPDTVSKVVSLANSLSNIQILIPATRSLLEKNKASEVLDVVVNFQNNNVNSKAPGVLLEILSNAIKLLPASEIQAGMTKLHSITPSIQNSSHFAISRGYNSALISVILVHFMESDSNLDNIANACRKVGLKHPKLSISGMALSVLYSDCDHISETPLRLLRYADINSSRDDTVLLKSIPHMNDVVIVTTAPRQYFDAISNSQFKSSDVILKTSVEILPSFPEFVSAEKILLLDEMGARALLHHMKEPKKLNGDSVVVVPFSTILAIWDKEYVECQERSQIVKRDYKKSENPRTQTHKTDFPLLRQLSQFIELNRKQVVVLSLTTEILMNLGSRIRGKTSKTQRTDPWDEIIVPKIPINQLENSSQIAGYLGSQEYRKFASISKYKHQNISISGHLICQPLVYGAISTSMLSSLFISPLTRNKKIYVLNYIYQMKLLVDRFPRAKHQLQSINKKDIDCEFFQNMHFIGEV